MAGQTSESRCSGLRLKMDLEPKRSSRLTVIAARSEKNWEIGKDDDQNVEEALPRKLG